MDWNSEDGNGVERHGEFHFWKKKRIEKKVFFGWLLDQLLEQVGSWRCASEVYLVSSGWIVRPYIYLSFAVGKFVELI